MLSRIYNRKLFTIFLQFYSEVLMKDQQNADAIYVKGLTLYYQDMSEKATKFFHQVLRLNPDHRPSQKIIRVSFI